MEILAAFLGRKMTEPALTILKQHLDAFDDLRDVQVQLAFVHQLVSERPEAKRFATYLLKRQRRYAKQTRKKIRGIKTRPLARCVEACSDQLQALQERLSQRRAAALLERAVDRAFQRVRQLRRAIDPDNSATIHRTRLAFKRFRYMVEALSPLLPWVKKSQFTAMRDFQTIMGDIQDIEVLLASLARFKAKKKLKSEETAGLRSLLLEHRDRSITRCMESLHVLESFWTSERDSTAHHPDP